MGILVRNIGDPKEWTPDYSTNATGGTSWGGKHVSMLTATDLVALLDFCRGEASRVGWNDAANSRTDVAASNPFHAELLGGYPHREWATYYVEGICEHTMAASERIG
ncbi:hypothetical protein IAG25_32850 [Caballeronia sp. EK]|uniref:hypothetical protein n=1 Tax=Caballeronia sp. EK TaxID=2767469 RepID=UPI001654C51B|nr:hypothetical protein [Caballeronia sp. EK]MBC8641615.1 hypothetical protein [Caballeronia sp. EK]